MPNPQWLDWARRFQAIAQVGLAYCKDPYDRQRYEEIQRLAADIESLRIKDVMRSFAYDGGDYMFTVAER